MKKREIFAMANQQGVVAKSNRRLMEDVIMRRLVENSVGIS